ncbi:hypothetical protein MPH_00549 [Macrophomina phaseolina MS6]|uniref:Uncharacterized protein n=1 Tax=Macrophomina phaseolina (strain MS6) TaxID=1126212 RepID=K2SI20_MACPH|nr:hypothetical protein MPH_00549 [Macrophomina phaseolina MS6]
MAVPHVAVSLTLLRSCDSDSRDLLGSSSANDAKTSPRVTTEASADVSKTEEADSPGCPGSCPAFVDGPSRSLLDEESNFSASTALSLCPARNPAGRSEIRRQKTGSAVVPSSRAKIIILFVSAPCAFAILYIEPFGGIQSLTTLLSASRFPYNGTNDIPLFRSPCTFTLPPFPSYSNSSSGMLIM